MILSINSSVPRAAYLHRRPKLALRQEMTWRYIGTKPFIQPMLTYDSSQPIQQILMKLFTIFAHFQRSKYY